MSQYDTDIELALDLANQGAAQMAVTQLQSGWVFLGLNQILKGTCFLVAEPVVTSLDDLSAESRAVFMEDMLTIGRAVKTVTGADKINYLFLGNKDPVLHVHIVPRYSEEDPKYRTHGPWRYEEYLKFDVERDQALIDQLRESLNQDSRSGF